MSKNTKKMNKIIPLIFILLIIGAISYCVYILLNKNLKPIACSKNCDIYELEENDKKK